MPDYTRGNSTANRVARLENCGRITPQLRSRRGPPVGRRRSPIQTAISLKQTSCPGTLSSRFQRPDCRRLIGFQPGTCREFHEAAPLPVRSGGDLPGKALARSRTLPVEKRIGIRSARLIWGWDCRRLAGFRLEGDANFTDRHDRTGGKNRTPQQTRRSPASGVMFRQESRSHVPHLWVGDLGSKPGPEDNSDTPGNRR